MSDKTVVSFPVHGFTGGHYEYWLGWVECELSILGFDLKEVTFDWRAAFDGGLKPEQAAAEAVNSIRPQRSSA